MSNRGQLRGPSKTYLVKEVVEKLYANEHRRGVCQLVCNSIEEDLWTEDIVLWASLAPLGLQCGEAQLEDA